MSHCNQEKIMLVMHGQLILSNDTHSPTTHLRSLVRIPAHAATAKLTHPEQVRGEPPPLLVSVQSRHASPLGCAWTWDVLSQLGTQTQSFMGQVLGLG